ncbi:hypothetical protein ALC56_11660 [Trachymyrmex septentrionalis]|uniref:Uncharacterized protein n=1 Tax=Trachymyrmex septentrionalis TaxID=34720 RepID=A0A151JTI0_9HYME|nr:hypothetical protein ALC56_11660 [Trachymyrmex septentrionalis]
MMQKEFIRYLKNKFNIIKLYDFLMVHLDILKTRRRLYDVCGGLADIVKRFAYRANLQLETLEEILSVFQSYQWASQSINNVDFIYLDNDMYNKTMKFLNTDCLEQLEELRLSYDYN